jgi:uncharacterized protein YbjT (DUF2867 family)
MILVMGATGHIGSKIVQNLLSNGQKVRCIARKFPNREAYKGCELVIGDANEVSLLNDAMRDCTSAFVMIPSDITQPEARFYQNKLGEVIAEAIEESGIKKIVNLSSLGADLESGTGPILGLHDQEERLNEITHADIVHLRPAFFMENLISQLHSIVEGGKIFSTMPAEVPVNMVATRDIAARAAFLLANPNFKSHNVEYLLGQRTLTFGEVTKVLGQAIGKNIEYIEVPPKEAVKSLLQAGMSEDWAEAMVEMQGSLSNGTITSTVQRDRMNTTATSIEEFAGSDFLAAYKEATGAAAAKSRSASSSTSREARP